MGICNTVVSADAANAAFLGKDPFPVHALGPGKRSWAYAANLLPWLNAYIAEYDAVILHGLWQYPAYAAYKAMQQARSREAAAPKFYIYPHGMLDPWFQRDKTRRVKAVRNWLYWKLIENRVIAAADAVLFTCEEEKRLAATTFRPYRPRAAVTVGYGIPDPVAAQAEAAQVSHEAHGAHGEHGAAVAAFYERFPELKGKRFLLFLSRIHPKKGVDLLLKAWGAGHGAGIEGQREPLHLVIAGPCADETYLNELKALATKNPPPSTLPHCPSPLNAQSSTIHWPGMLSGDVKWGALAAAEAFVLPSHQENFGIAVVEALACGTPVLISDQVNIFKEIVAAGAGFAATDSVDGTAELLRRWLALSDAEKAAMRTNARACFLQTFTVTAAAQKLQTAIQSK